ncbi:MAG: serine/threonine-protein kinase [Planctomycetota bacterium]
MSARQEDFVFAEHVLRRGFATEEQVQECLDLVARMRGEMSLDETLEAVLLKRGYLAPAQAQVISQTINPEAAGRSRNQIEGYRLLARLGSGAMGSVYKARHQKLDILVALKVLRVELAQSKTQVERLKREAQLAARLNHPNIVRSLDVGESNGFHYFAMEFVDGPTARSLIRENRMNEKEAVRIVLAVARALEHAHQNGVIHRDVKPANVMLSKSGETVKLGDFGLARGQGPSELTLEHAAIGTPQYLAPEQAASAANATPRSDLFSLGATLYHLVTGQPPFSGDTLAEIFGKVIRAEFEPPEVVVNDLSVDTLYLIHRLMRPNPRDRYASATELIVDLEKIEQGQRVAPAEFKGDYQAFLDKRRQKRTAVAAAAIVVILASIWFTVSAITASQARRDALAACEALNGRGDGELAALATLDDLRKKHAELGEAMADGSGCATEMVRDLARRIELLGTDLARVEKAEDVLVRARQSGANYQLLAREADAIQPVLEGASERAAFVRREIGSISAAEAEKRYAEVYVVYATAPEAIAALRALAGELRTRFLPVESDWAGDVALHASELESLKFAYDKASSEHGEHFEDAVKAKDFDSAARHLELIRQARSEAYSRAKATLDAKFLQWFPLEDTKRRKTASDEERDAWGRTKDAAIAEDGKGRPDKALELVKKFHSGSEGYRKTAEVELRRLEERRDELLAEQERVTLEMERTFRSALGERQYAAARDLVYRRKGDYAWFGEGARRFATVERRADAIDRLVKQILPRLRQQRSVPVARITGEPKLSTAPGAAFSGDPQRDRYVLTLGKRTWEFALRDLEYATLADVFRVKTAKGRDLRAAGYFLVAESFGKTNPVEARDLLQDARAALLAATDDWVSEVDAELKRKNERIQTGEKHAQDLLQHLARVRKDNDHDSALLYCDRLIKEFGWTDKVRENRKRIDDARDELNRLVGAGTLRKSYPKGQFVLHKSGVTEIRYTGAAWHPLGDRVPQNVDRASWLATQERKHYKNRWLGRNEGIANFDDYFHRATHQLLDWRGKVDVRIPGKGELAKPPGYVLQGGSADEPDRLWWQKKFKQLDHTVGLINRFDPKRDWSVEFTIDWVESAWTEKEVVSGEVVVVESRERVPVYFSVACGKVQGAIGFFPKKNGGVAGTRIFLEEEMAPPDGHAGELSDFHWHMANETNRKTIRLKDRAWLDRRIWKSDVPYRIRLARIGREIHLWMTPLASWNERGPFVSKTFPLDVWRKGKAGDYKRAVHVFYKEKRARELNKAVEFPRGLPQFRFFDRVRFTLRDVVVAGYMPPQDGKE